MLSLWCYGFWLDYQISVLKTIYVVILLLMFVARKRMLNRWWWLQRRRWRWWCSEEILELAIIWWILTDSSLCLWCHCRSNSPTTCHYFLGRLNCFLHFFVILLKRVDYSWCSRCCIMHANWCVMVGVWWLVSYGTSWLAVSATYLCSIYTY